MIVVEIWANIVAGPQPRHLFSASSFQYPVKRTAAYFIDGKPGGGGFLLCNSAAVHRFQKEIEQSLARGRIVEDIAREGGNSRPFDKGSQAEYGIIIAVEEKMISSRIAHGQLCGVEIPALVKAVDE